MPLAQSGFLGRRTMYSKGVWELVWVWSAVGLQSRIQWNPAFTDSAFTDGFRRTRIRIPWTPRSLSFLGNFNRSNTCCISVRYHKQFVLCCHGALLLK